MRSIHTHFGSMPSGKLCVGAILTPPRPHVVDLERLVRKCCRIGKLHPACIGGGGGHGEWWWWWLWCMVMGVVVMVNGGSGGFGVESRRK